MLKTDESFCRSGKGQVSQLIEVRRRHGECKVGDGGCEVVLGSNCGGERKTKAKRVLMIGQTFGKGGQRTGWVVWIVGLLLASLGVNLLLLWRYQYEGIAES